MKNLLILFFLFFQLTSLFANQHEDISAKGSISSIIEGAGSISGYVLANGGSSIPEARVSLVNGSTASVLSNSDGFYQIYNLAPGYGYEVMAEKSGYLPQTIASVIVQENTITENINFNLQSGHSPDGPFNITEPDFKPNPQISVVGAGGSAIRYYKITNASTGEIVPSMKVYLTEDVSTISNSAGIAAVHINSVLVGKAGASKSFTIYKIGDYTLPTSKQITFQVDVTERQYSKEWKSSVYGEFGVSWVSCDFERSAKVGISIIDDGEARRYDSLTVKRQGRDGVEISYGVSTPAKVKFGDFNEGAGAEVGVNLGAIAGDYYRFPNEGYNSYQAVAQYILFADGNYTDIDDDLIRYLGICEDWFTDQESLNESYLGDYKGINLKRSGETNAAMGIGPSNKNKKILSVDMNMSAEVSTIFQMQSFAREDVSKISVSSTGTMEGDLNFTFPYPASFENYTMDLKTGGGGTLGGELGIAFKNGNWDYNWFTYLRGYKGYFDVSFNSEYGTVGADRQIKTSYFFPSENIKSIMKNIDENVSKLETMRYHPAKILFNMSSYGNLLYNTLQDISEHSKENPEQYKASYIKKRTDRYPISNYEVSLAVSAGEKTLSGQVGMGRTFTKMYNWTREKGVLYNWEHYPTEKYHKPGLSAITYKSKVQEIYDNTPWFLKIKLATSKTLSKELSLAKAGSEFIIGDNNSKVIFAEGSLILEEDLDCFYWSWWGNSSSAQKKPLSKKTHRIFSSMKKRAQDNQKLEYGIGGFYQFEPYNLALNDANSTLTIVYSDTEVVDFSEQELAIYKKDKKHNRWVYLGGAVDAVNNTVIVNIDTLGLFTLAPKSPAGKILLKSSIDSLPADGASQAVINSETLYYNDGSPVNDGSLYTIALDNGKILSEDEDRTINGIQVSVNSGKISFTVQSDTLSVPATIKAKSLSGNSSGTVSLTYTDDIAPSAPALSTITVKKGRVYLSWDKVNEPDISGYKIYFDTDASGAPYNGTASIDGRPSPIDVGKILEAELNGLTPDTTYYFAVTSYDLAGNESVYSNELTIVTSLNNAEEFKIPKDYFLGQNYPNPFNPLTKMQYELPKSALVKIVIYNSLGQKIKTLVDKNQLAGKHTAIWHGRNSSGYQVASGVYFYKIQAGNYIKVKKMVLVR